MRIILTNLIRAMDDAADLKFMKSRIDLSRRLMKQWSCPARLLKYLMRTISIGAGQPKRFDIRLMYLVPLLMAKLLSTTKALHLHYAGEKLDR